MGGRHGEGAQRADKEVAQRAIPRKRTGSVDQWLSIRASERGGSTAMYIAVGSIIIDGSLQQVIADYGPAPSCPDLPAD